MGNNKLKIALSNPIWKDHRITDYYTMDSKPDLWKIAYYPMFDSYDNSVARNGKTVQVNHILFEEPRALIEHTIIGSIGQKIGIDFREVPLRYLTKKIK